MSVTVLLSAQQLSKVTENHRAKSSRLTEHRAFRLKVRLGSMVYEGWLSSVRCSSNLSSVGSMLDISSQVPCSVRSTSSRSQAKSSGSGSIAISGCDYTIA